MKSKWKTSLTRGQAVQMALGAVLVVNAVGIGVLAGHDISARDWGLAVFDTMLALGAGWMAALCLDDANEQRRE